MQPWTDLLMYGSGRRPIGASTITQQVAKNMLLGNEVSFGRKAKELILALRIEESLPKDRILELYLNEIYLGLQAHGVAAAAQAYFNKGLDDLTLPEAAFLAVLPKAPNNYNPTRFYEAAKTRRDWVIDRMVDDHLATPEQGTAAKATPVALSPFRRPETAPGSEWFAEEVRRQLVAAYGADATHAGRHGRAYQHRPIVAGRRRPLAAGWPDVLRPCPYRLSRAGAAARRGRGAAGGLEQPPGDDDPAARHAARMAARGRAGGRRRRGQAWLAGPSAGPVAECSRAYRAPGRCSCRTPAGPGPQRGTGYGPSPRRIGDVVQVGDVVMAELIPASAAAGKASPRPERLVLPADPDRARRAGVAGPGDRPGCWRCPADGASSRASSHRATQAERQPGSSFKPMVYLTAMEAGISPSQRVLDAPFVQDMGAQGQWRPGNFEPTFNGPTPAADRA